jgi:hypothetical protein
MAINPENDLSKYGHSHEQSQDAEIIPIHFNRAVTSDFSAEVSVGNNKWHTPLAYGAFAGLTGGIMTLPTIEMIESENGFGVDVPGSINSAALVVGGVLFVSTAIYKHFKG